MEPKHLAVLYDILSELPAHVTRRLVRDGTMSADEIIDATNALANELNREPLIDAADLED